MDGKGPCGGSPILCGRQIAISGEADLKWATGVRPSDEFGLKLQSDQHDDRPMEQLVKTKDWQP